MIHNSIHEWFFPKYDAVGCYIEHNGDILMLHRAKSDGIEPNKWGIPAGKLEDNESAIEGMIREIQEETGINTTPEQLQYMDHWFVEYPEVDFIFHEFKLELNYKPKITLNPKEHQNYKWTTPRDAVRMKLVRDARPLIMRNYKL